MGLIRKLVSKFLAPVDNRGGWWPWVREPFAGAWQQNEEWKMDDVSAYFAVYACITLISSDIGKLPYLLMQEDSNGIWKPLRSIRSNIAEAKRINSILSLFKRPNGYQNHIQFKQWWLSSKLFRGNVYVLKQRNAAGEVERLYILNPDLVTVLVAKNGEVFYQLSSDNISGLTEATITVPASEIIHDRMCCLFHPLVGVSPLYASGLAAHQGLKIQNDSSIFFSNGARPGGILSAPGSISDETARRLKEYWDANYTGRNAGKVAVLGDDLKFQMMRMSAQETQLIEQLKWTAEVICSTYHVPPYKIGVGPLPTGNNAEVLNTEYYSRCLQILIEDMEQCLFDGLGVPEGYKVQLDLDILFRMDQSTLIKTLSEGVKGTVYTPNEARGRLNLSPLEGGDTVYMQEQNYSLSALAQRDAADPTMSGQQPNNTPPADDNQDVVTDEEAEAQARSLAALFQKEIRNALTH